MTPSPRSDAPNPDLLRRLREFQIRVRQPQRKVDPVVPARGPLSARDVHIIGRLRRLSPALADSLEQALKDLNDHTRLSYVGPAGEVREVMRAATQQMAPDEQVRQQPWFTGIEQGGKRNPSQAERIRYVVQQRGGSKAAFENGTLNSEDLAERLSQLKTRTRQPSARRDELARQLDAEPAMPPSATLREVAHHIDGVIAAGSHSQRKALIEALVAQVKITGPGRIVPVFRIPQATGTEHADSSGEVSGVRALTNLVGWWS